MVIAVSACLLGENCKYNGGNNAHHDVLAFVQGHTVIPVCPERMGGLPTPRKPAELVGGRVQNADGTDVDEAFRRGARLAFQTVEDAKAELVILQPRSPSCGVRQVYDGSFSKTLVDGQGVFAKLLTDAGYRVMEACAYTSERNDEQR